MLAYLCISLLHSLVYIVRHTTLCIDRGPLVIPLIFCSSLFSSYSFAVFLFLSLSLTLLHIFTMPDVTTPTANTPLDTDVSDSPVPSNPHPIVDPLTPVSPTPNMEAHRPFSSSIPPTIRIDLSSSFLWRWWGGFLPMVSAAGGCR